MSDGSSLSSRDPLFHLNLNVIALIVEQLDAIDIIRLRRVAKHWNEVLGSEYIARIALLSHFPDSPEAQEYRAANAKQPPAPPATDQPEQRPAKKRRTAKKTKATKDEMPSVVVGFRRATYRHHARLTAKPTQVYKYRLHHISEKTFAVTSTHIFWLESSRRIWVQKIGDGVGGRRFLKLKAVGDRIAQVHQIAATEDGLIVLVYREVFNWQVEMIALCHQTEEVIWRTKPNTPFVAISVTGSYLLCTSDTIPRDSQAEIYSLLTGKLLHQTPLQAPLSPRQDPIILGECAIFPPTKPNKIFAAYALNEPRGITRYIIRVSDLKGNILHSIDIARNLLLCTWPHRAERLLRLVYLPANKKGQKLKIMAVEATSNPHLKQNAAGINELCDPTLSSWTINPETYDIEEIRRYHSEYTAYETVPTPEHVLRDGAVMRDGPIYDHSRFEYLDVVKGISYIYYDENSKKEETDEESGAQQDTRKAKLDAIGYEEDTARAKSLGAQRRAALQIKTDGVTKIRSYPFHNPVFCPLHQQPVTSYETSKASIPLTLSSSGFPQQPVERHFFQTSRHRLTQPDIMKRRRKFRMGEEEEDWQLLPVKSSPSMYGDFKISADGKLVDGRYLCLLAKCTGWTITCFVLDFNPNW